MIGIVPAFIPDAGGIQVAGRIAWEGVTARLGARARDATLIEYGGHGLWEQRGEHVVTISSKYDAVWHLLRRRWSTEVVLVWHISLLKLVPLLRLSSARVVVILHGIEAWKPQEWLVRRMFSRVTLFLSDSQCTRERFLAHNPSTRTIAHQVSALGLGTSMVAPPTQPSGPPAALMVGRLVRNEDYKGHREMIAVWPAVRQRVPNAELWIVGDGNLRPDLTAAVAAHGADCGVRFFGWVSEEEKARLIERCRVMALPSRGEGFGLVYLEAMRMGRPCLVGSVDAGREVVNPPEAGLSVDPRNPEELAGTVCRLLTPGPAWEQWSLGARLRYEQHFTTAHFQQRLLAALVSTEDGRPRTDDC